MPAPPDDIAAVVFDCDGVLLDSNALKTSCFEEVLLAAGYATADVVRFVTFQRASFGMSRYRLFETFLGWDLAERPALDRDALVARYAEALAGRYVHAAATPGMREVVRRLARRFPVYIVSGSDEAELRGVMAARGDADPFRLILGSPATKVDNLRTVLAHLGRDGAAMEPGRVVFVGDARADLDAAEALGMGFVYMDAFSAAQAAMRKAVGQRGLPLIEDLNGLEAALSGTPALWRTA
jgi:phosphoglycolate phosphatase-like HAD superfamily hydrolase